MLQPPPATNNHQIKAKITRMADIARVSFERAGNTVLLLGGDGMQGGCAIGAIFDLNRDQDISALGDDVDFTDRAFMAACENAIAF